MIRTQKAVRSDSALDVINVNLSLISEFKGAFAIFLAKCVCLIDLGIFGQFAVCFYCRAERAYQSLNKSERERSGDGDARFRASSAVYFTITSAFPSWNSRRDSSTISPWFIQTCHRKIFKLSLRLTSM